VRRFAAARGYGAPSSFDTSGLGQGAGQYATPDYLQEGMRPLEAPSSAAVYWRWSRRHVNYLLPISQLTPILPFSMHKETSKRRGGGERGQGRLSDAVYLWTGLFSNSGPVSIVQGSPCHSRR